LINKIHEEPYRMFTSRAEFRLLLRQDNADLRLMDYGRGFGLIDDSTYKRFLNKREEVEEIYTNEINNNVSPDIFNDHFRENSSSIKQSSTINDLVKRPELNLQELLSLVSKNAYSKNAINEVEFNLKYSGYVERQKAQINKFKKSENKIIPEFIDYQSIKALSAEAIEKLSRIRPSNLGQASRISGVSPADLSVLIIFLEKYNHLGVSRETGFIHS